MKTCLLMSAVALALIPSAAASQTVPQQPDTVQLSELVVTATRLQERIADAPGSITVLRGSALRSNGSRTLADALRAVPGISIAQSAGPGALTSLFIRGGESDYVQVLVDGVQVNEPGGSFDWAHMSTEGIERVEIVRGPASVLYGSDAVSGVIQIFTRAGGTHRIEAGVTASRGDKDAADAGSFDTRGFDASLTGGAPVRAAGGAIVQYGISAAHTASTGLFAFNSDYDRTHVAGRVKLGGTRGDIALTSRVADNEYHYPTSGSGAVVDRNQFSTGGSRSFSADAGYRLLAPIELRVLGTLHDTDSRTENPPDGTEADRYWSTTEQQRRALDARVNVELPGTNVLTLGAEREWQEAETAFESVSGFGTATDDTHETRTNIGWYAQLHGAPVDALSLTLGARIDDNEQFGTFRTGRAALSWRFARAVRVHASVGTAFKEPTFYENFATAYSRGNPDLEPEQANSRDAGVEYAALDGRLTLGATWFEQRFRNLIQYTFTTPSPDDPNYFNVGAARARGLEASAAAALGALKINASYTLTATRVTDDGFGDDMAFQEGRRMLRRPEHQAAVNASMRITPAMTALIDARYVGERDDLDFSDPEQWSGVRTSLNAFTVLDAGFVYGIVRGGGPSIDLSAGIRNLLDRQYQEIRGFPTPGRVLYLGIRAGTGL
ncbi:MAG TPA: TonB-dependent receptor [Longimicrobiales bacterium]|nr:TonB-dependent receptor [Longimicrobiales bacterium]